MGQKTHPVGYRLSVNKKWNSNWFASKNDFSSELEEDVRIRKYISHRLPNAGISKVEIARTSKKVTITIYTARPGIVIGRGGEEVNRLKKDVNKWTNIILGYENGHQFLDDRFMVEEHMEELLVKRRNSKESPNPFKIISKDKSWNYKCKD